MHIAPSTAFFAYACRSARVYRLRNCCAYLHSVHRVLRCMSRVDTMQPAYFEIKIASRPRLFYLFVCIICLSLFLCLHASELLACLVRSLYQSIYRTLWSFFHPSAPPYPSAYIHPPIAVQSDQPVVLNCQVIAMPQPTYSWLLYNSQNYQTYPIDHLNVVINGSMLSIPSIYSATAAYSIWFVCLASNAYGEGRHYFRLDISPSPLVSSLPSSLLSTPTTEVLSAALQSGLEAGGNTVLPVIVATVCAGLVALLSILCFTGLALYLSRNCRR